MPRAHFRLALYAPRGAAERAGDTVSGRVVDRTIRPLFPQHIRNEVQVIITILALDEEDPDVVAVNAASLALATSNIPWAGPVAAVRIGKHDGAFITNPTYAERETIAPRCSRVRQRRRPSI